MCAAEKRFGSPPCPLRTPTPYGDLRRGTAGTFGGGQVGATGAIQMTKLVYELQRRKAKYGLQTMCIGHGMATATIIERL